MVPQAVSFVERLSNLGVSTIIGDFTVILRM